jgi:PncC family amidohydrolase
VAGSSEVFTGSIVSYQRRVKEELLGVSPEVLDEYGVYSQHCAALMGLGAQDLLGCDWAVGVTGIAGPDGALPDNPVGAVYIMWVEPASFENPAATGRRYEFQGSREEIQWKAAIEALTGLLSRLG